MHEYHPEIIDNAVCLRLYVNGSKTTISYRLDFTKPKPDAFSQEEWDAAYKLQLAEDSKPF
jgi:hypothetical protein